MAKIIISKQLSKEILRKFNRTEANKIKELFETLKKNPKKGKAVGHIEQIVIKELKYGKFRFYFITDGNILKFGTEQELAQIMIKFIKMSEKKNQQKIITEIKEILTKMGF